jgi:pSer/pThr/pTyr-binding forkhead associated (FHA) protein
MPPLYLDIIEGPRAGQSVALDTPKVIGREGDVDIVVDDERASRRHARLSPSSSGAVVEDLESTNGTFVNQDEVHGPAVLAPGDELLVGTTVLVLRDAAARRQQSAVVNVPPALAAAERQPTYVPRGGGGGGPVVTGQPVGRAPEVAVPELDRLVDTRTKGKAKVAPLAIFVLVALAILIYIVATQ